MENEKTETSKKTNFLRFVKRNAYYLVLGLLILVLAIAIIATSGVAVDREDGPSTPTSVNTITFSSPVLNGQITKGYSATELQYNSVLKLWEIHKAVDYSVAVGTDVLAVYDGTVTDVRANLLEGTVVEIDHGDGLKTTYGSLDSYVKVGIGDMVKRGDIIGKASNTATAEASGDGEVHFEVWKDGNLVDPANYLDMASLK